MKKLIRSAKVVYRISDSCLKVNMYCVIVFVIVFVKGLKQNGLLYFYQIYSPQLYLFQFKTSLSLEVQLEPPLIASETRVTGRGNREETRVTGIGVREGENQGRGRNLPGGNHLVESNQIYSPMQHTETKMFQTTACW